MKIDERDFSAQYLDEKYPSIPPEGEELRCAIVRWRVMLEDLDLKPSTNFVALEEIESKPGKSKIFTTAIPSVGLIQLALEPNVYLAFAIACLYSGYSGFLRKQDEQEYVLSASGDHVGSTGMMNKLSPERLEKLKALGVMGVLSSFVFLKNFSETVVLPYGLTLSIIILTAKKIMRRVVDTRGALSKVIHQAESPRELSVGSEELREEVNILIDKK